MAEDAKVDVGVGIFEYLLTHVGMGFLEDLLTEFDWEREKGD